MSLVTSLDECMKFAGKYNYVPVVKEFLSDVVTPIAFLMHLKEMSKRTFLLESADGQGNQGRYTFLGCNPILRMRGEKDGVRYYKQGESSFQKEDINAALRKVLSAYKTPQIEGLPPFLGGLVGYFSYDYITKQEPTLNFEAEDVLKLPLYDVMLFENIIAFDRQKQKIYLVAYMQPEDGEVSYLKARVKLEEMENLLLGTTPRIQVEHVKMGPFSSNFTKERFEKTVEKIKEYIKAGDIFQAVLAQRFSATYEGSLIPAYRYLRTINPSQYMFYLENEEVEIAGASPETLVKVQNRHILNLPIAGTRKRGGSPLEDETLEKELLSDEKERAEHTMLVDLGRNDVGRVSAFNSVKVSSFMKVARFSHVMHIVSQVEGDLAEDKDCLDALGAILPAGTLSGAPKIRACEIIDELEPSLRGFYGGGLGYIDFNGNMDTCITIRSIIKKDGVIHIQSGGGIVADSVPENEYFESMNKAKAMMSAIEMVKGE